ncbi:hypothetical protein LguiA_004975 [Lonicera macranthoides]
MMRSRFALSASPPSKFNIIQFYYGEGIDSAQSIVLTSDLKNKKSMPLNISLDTKVKVKMETLKTKKVRVRATCGGIKTNVPTRNLATTATTSDAKCKVDLRIKIWKWTV